MSIPRPWPNAGHGCKRICRTLKSLKPPPTRGQPNWWLIRRAKPRGGGKVAAITGILAAEKYGLPVLEQDIQDNAANATRFLVLGRQCSPPTGDDRTSLLVSVADKAGALHQAIAAFRRYKINMTKIESRPSKRKAWEYFFFIDCDGHVQDRKVVKAIQLLGEHCNFVKVLGSYPNAE